MAFPPVDIRVRREYIRYRFRCVGLECHCALWSKLIFATETKIAVGSAVDGIVFHSNVDGQDAARHNVQGHSSLHILAQDIVQSPYSWQSRREKKKERGVCRGRFNVSGDARRWGSTIRSQSTCRVRLDVWLR